MILSVKFDQFLKKSKNSPKFFYFQFQRKNSSQKVEIYKMEFSLYREV